MSLFEFKRLRPWTVFKTPCMAFVQYFDVFCIAKPIEGKILLLR